MIDVQKRYVLAIFAFFGTFNVYSLRNNITVAIIDMTNTVSVQNENFNNGTVCPLPPQSGHENTNISDVSESRSGMQYSWDKDSQVRVLNFRKKCINFVR